MFVDSATIFVQSGKGGNGAVSFLRSKYSAKGGPNGGNGGKGGDVIFVADPNVTTLMDMAGKHHWRAEVGGRGDILQQTGKNGNDLIIRVPLGTVIFNTETKELIKDIDEYDEPYIIAKGGRGGFGNEHFKTPIHQTPQEATDGADAVEMTIRLDLKLMADIGLAGLPNAGKSTFLSRVSKATPRIADYPFTTLEPNLGITKLSNYRRMVIADIPGLIEGASEGHGLGITFLKHVERTRVLIHLIDIDPADNSDPIENYRIISKELDKYSDLLADKIRIVAISKMDLLPTEEDRQAAVDLFKEEFGVDIFPISSASGYGLEDLLESCWDIVSEFRKKEELIKRKEAAQRRADKNAAELAHEQKIKDEAAAQIRNAEARKGKPNHNNNPK